jgi:anti-anti-sigma factor
MHTSDTPPIVVQSIDDGRQELKLSGDINVCLSTELHGECVRLAHQGKDAVVDCENVESFDAAALQILTALKDAMTLQGRDLQFHGLTPEIEATLFLSGLKQHLGAGCTL